MNIISTPHVIAEAAKATAGGGIPTPTRSCSASSAVNLLIETLDEFDIYRYPNGTLICGVDYATSAPSVTAA